MPVVAVRGGFRWGSKGKVYKTRAEAEKQGAAAHANGFEEPAKKRTGKRLHIRADLASGGSLHVRHMSDGDEQAETLIDLDAKAHEGSAPVWIQIAKRGAFNGHPSGPFTLDDRVFDDIIRNFGTQSNPRVPIDYEHATEATATSGGIPVHGAPAQGWITALEKRNDGLWGLVEWLPQAREQIRAGQYRYFSPAIRFNSRDKVTNAPVGARLSSGALTNTPFLIGMPALAAKDSDGATVCASMLASHPADMLPKMRDALGLDPLASHADMRACIARLCELYDDAGDAYGMAEGIELAPYTQRLAALHGGFGVDVLSILQALDNVLDEILGPLDQDEPDEDDAAGMADQATTEQDPITMTEPAVNTIPLKDHETAVSALSLQLKDAESKLAERDAELKTLKDAEVARIKAEQTKRVDVAFATYKDARKLSDADKDAMAIVLKNNPDLFGKLYPEVPAAQAPLLRKLTEGRTGDEPASEMTVPSMKALTDKHLKAGKSIEEATSLAYAETVAATR